MGSQAGVMTFYNTLRSHKVGGGGGGGAGAENIHFRITDKWGGGTGF